MKTIAKFTFDTVRYDQENELHLVVTLDAPKTDWQKNRAPICVMPVIDVSGSMNGKPLEYAKKSAIKMVEHLSDQDYAGLVIFASEVEVVSTPLQMTQENKDQLRAKIGNLSIGGCTNFSGGMIAGLNEMAKADLPKEMIKRLIMLTDGCANVGVATDLDGLSSILKDKMGDVTVSCFGYRDGADQELLASLAKVGKANYAFIQNPDDALSAFAKELGGLLSTYAQDIKVVIEANNGHEILDVLSDVDTDGDNKKVTVSLPEILSEEKMHIVAKVKLSKQNKPLPREMSIFNVNVTYDSLTKDKALKNNTDKLTAKLTFVKPGKEQQKPDSELDKLVANAEIVKAQNEAEQLAVQGNYNAAQQALIGLSSLFKARGLGRHAAYTSSLGAKYCSSAAYEQSASYRVSANSMMTRSFGTSEALPAVYKDLSFTLSDTDNSVQDSLKKSFEDDNLQIDAPIVSNETNINKVKSSMRKSRKRW